ncbi:MAG: hypothetical protein A2V77_23505 [Anaeromyxobacter sp. RBG_16_69_14]|nr:MAG: hypothetical protein A2V77_23505 [Anaeromyxobacter sp. RBG_16_69_14]
MGKFCFTQCACVLFDSVPALDEVERALESWPLAARQAPAPGRDGWMACGPGFVVELRGGESVIIDLLDRPWPDDPLAVSKDPALDAAWRSGQFGPTSVPGALARARMQTWSWDEGAAAAERHRALLRLRTVVELGTDAPVEILKGRDPVHELSTLTEMAGGLLGVPGASALFLPGGEALRSREHIRAALSRKTGSGPPPLDLWLNLRAADLGQEGDNRWSIVDVVGMGQLRLPDQEALFAEGQERADVVAPLIRYACIHLVSGEAFADGSTVEDPRGGVWSVTSTTSALPPNRPVLRWLPQQGARPSEALLARL